MAFATRARVGLWGRRLGCDDVRLRCANPTYSCSFSASEQVAELCQPFTVTTRPWTARESRYSSALLGGFFSDPRCCLAHAHNELGSRPNSKARYAVLLVIAALANFAAGCLEKSPTGRGLCDT